MDLRKLESGRIATLVDLMLKAAAHVPPDRANWKPEGKGQSPQELLAHTAGANLFFAGLMQGTEAPPTGRYQNVQDITADSKTYQQAEEALRASAEVLVQTIRATTDEQLREERQMPWGERWKMTRLITAPSAHIAYHWGQLCYLQTLLGDVEDYR
jgi:uncharacterized damage-inducible protein DinB